MILRFKSIAPSDLLSSTCPACKAYTVHGFVGQLKWLPTEDATRLRPAVHCDGCLLPIGLRFEVEEVKEEAHPWP